MEICIKNKDLAELACLGSSKRYQVSNNVAEKFVLRLFQLEAAHNFGDLGLSKKIESDGSVNPSDYYSIKILGDYFLTIDVEWLDESKTKARVNIIDLKSSKDKSNGHT